MWSSYLFGPLSWTQWAAVSSQWLLNTDAPHTWPVPLMWRLTCQGHSPSRDAWPPTIRELRYGLVPQSENTRTHVYNIYKRPKITYSYMKTTHSCKSVRISVRVRVCALNIRQSSSSEPSSQSCSPSHSGFSLLMQRPLLQRNVNSEHCCNTRAERQEIQYQYCYYWRSTTDKTTKALTQYWRCRGNVS